MTIAIRVNAHSLDGSSLRDFIRICDHSGIHFGVARARKTALRIHGAVEMLAYFPYSGRMGRKPGTAELVISGLPFLAIYRLKNNAVEIIRILHGAQKWP